GSGGAADAVIAAQARSRAAVRVRRWTTRLGFMGGLRRNALIVAQAKAVLTIGTFAIWKFAIALGHGRTTASSGHRRRTAQVPARKMAAALRKFQCELSSGLVTLVLLAVLSRADEPMYGYQLAKMLERFGEGVLSGNQRALYPVLRNLEGAGFLASHVGPFD